MGHFVSNIGTVILERSDSANKAIGQRSKISSKEQSDAAFYKNSDPMFDQTSLPAR